MDREESPEKFQSFSPVKSIDIMQVSTKLKKMILIIDLFLFCCRVDKSPQRPGCPHRLALMVVRIPLIESFFEIYCGPRLGLWNSDLKSGENDILMRHLFR